MQSTPRSSVSHKPWLTDELLQMFEHEGMISGSGYEILCLFFSDDFYAWTDVLLCAVCL